MKTVKPPETEAVTRVRALLAKGHDPAKIGRCNWCEWTVFSFSAPPPRVPRPHDNPDCPYVAATAFLLEYDNPPA